VKGDCAEIRGLRKLRKKKEDLDAGFSIVKIPPGGWIAQSNRASNVGEGHLQYAWGSRRGREEKTGGGEKKIQIVREGEGEKK